MVKIVKSILLLSALTFLFYTKNNNESVSGNLWQNSNRKQSLLTNLNEYQVTKKCFKDHYKISLDTIKQNILIQKNDQDFTIPATKLIEEIANKEMVTDFMIVCNCLTDGNGISINYEFDLIHYKYKSVQHRIVFKEQGIFLDKAFNFYSDRQQETLFGKAYNSRILYSFDDAVDLESEATQLIKFRNFQDENYKQHIDQYYSTIRALFTKGQFDQMILMTDTSVLGIALNNVGIKEAITQYNDIAYYLEQAKAYEEAVFLLEKIVEEVPDRTVAYINLGDAYWGLDEKEKAKEAYKTYVDQMKTKGKEAKIPKRVLKRLK
ncbi:tetratricopeptide repeat protein [Aquimarina sp. SS2-1]|uniref:tetratricopeptide repeat protein n=1 Tax=Aquimarina besae TaxID=3342247 RepID=UPI003670983C